MAEPGSIEFGEFQAVRVVNQVGAATIYAARRAADVGEPAYAVKYLQAPEFWGEEETAARLRQFIRRAALQKRVADAAAASGEMTWAPVYGAPQSTDNGAFYVTDLYPRSAEDLCGGRRGTVDAAKLWGIVDSVVSGLRLLDRVAQRPHGNLKAGNVLLKGRGMGIRACLADPVPDDDAARAAGHAADFSALGKLVYGLVLHEVCPLDSRLPAPPAAPWTALGRNGDAWRELCNRCLGAAAPFEGLDELADTVAALRPSDKPRKTKWVVAAIVLLAAAAGGAIAREQYLRRFDFDPKKWEALCRHEWRWLETLRQSQGTLDNIPEYKSLAAGVKETDGLKSPNELAGVPQSWRPEDLAQSSKVKHDRDVGKATVDALDAIDSLRKRLDNSPPVMAIESYRREHPGAAAAEELKNVVEGARKLPDAKALG